ncbi:MAG: hypothetical protein KUG71_05255 [Porticoccaceae bacterium]|nr:hypothetical protein [Porticoccaceae bacterium]
MTLSEFADLAEILSGIAVLVTLIFLVFQIRDNTKAMRINVLSTHYTDGLEVIADGSRIPALAEAAYKAFTHQPLEGVDRYHLSNWVSRTGGLMERALLMTQSGILDHKNFERAVLSGKNLLSTPAARKSYEVLLEEGLFGPEIREYIDNFYAELDRQASHAFERATEDQPA